MRAYVSMLVIALTLVTPNVHAANGCGARLGGKTDNHIHAYGGGMGSSRWAAVNWTAKADVPNARLLAFLEEVFKEDPDAVVRSTIPERALQGQEIHTPTRKLGWRSRFQFWFDRNHVRVKQGKLPGFTTYDVESPKFGKLSLSYLADGGEEALGLRVRHRLFKDEKFLEALSRLISGTAMYPLSAEEAWAQLADELSPT